MVSTAEMQNNCFLYLGAMMQPFPAMGKNSAATKTRGTSDFVRLVTGTSADVNHLERQPTVRWPPHDGQPTPTLEQNLSREPQTVRRPPKDGRPTQTDARQKRTDQAQGLEDETHTLR